MTELARSAERLRGGRCLVVGDVMLDEYVFGRVSRISPEAPIPVVHVDEEMSRLGGAANVACNLHSLGCEVRLLGVVGDDRAGRHVRSLATGAGVIDALMSVPRRPTISKTRVIAGVQQVVRFDREDTMELPDEAAAELVARAGREMRDGSADVLVLSDYAKGTLGHEVCRRLIALAREHRLPVIVDPKGRDYARYQGATMITPNMSELRDAVGLPHAGREELLERGQVLRGRLGLTQLVLTEGSGGMSLLDASGARRFPAHRREVFDVSGAGDTVVAVLAAAVAARVDIDIACRLANVAAGVVIGHVGTSPLDADEFTATLEAGEGGAPTGVYSLGDLQRCVRDWRTRGEKVVFTNGCFDLLHAGHLSSLEAARREGERLVVAINSDRSVARLKGPGRPVNREQDRARVLAALSAVDAVCVFDDETPLDVIRTLRPDVLAKGADYRVEDVVGAEDVQSWGGRVVLLDLVTGLSTTELVARIESRVR